MNPPIITREDEQRVQHLWQQLKTSVKSLEAGLPELHRALGDEFWARCKEQLGLSAFEATALMARGGYIIPRTPAAPKATTDTFREQAAKLWAKDRHRLIDLVEEFYAKSV